MKWIETTLGLHVDLISGPAFKSQCFTSDSSDIPLIKGENIGQGLILWEKSKFWPREDADNYIKFRLQQGDVILAMDRPWVSAGLKYAVISERDPEALLVQRVARIRGINGLSCGFLRYVISSPEFSGYIKNIMGGTNVPHISADQIRAFCFSLPFPGDQERIASILSAYDDLIENNRRRIQLLEQAARLLYREWFVRLRFPGHEHVKIKDGVPEGWEKKKLSDLCEEVHESVKPDAIEPDTPYIGLEHIPRRSISLSEWGLAEDVISNKNSFHEGDILFGKIRPYFHKVGIAFIDGITSSDAIVIRPNDSTLHALVLMTVSSDAFVAVTAQTMREGSKMPRADWKQMQAYSVLIPSQGILNSFETLVHSIVDQLKAFTFMNKRLCAARDLLLPRLMNGVIPV